MAAISLFCANMKKEDKNIFLVLALKWILPNEVPK